MTTSPLAEAPRPVLVHALASRVPPTYYTRERASEVMQTHVEGRPATRRVIRSLYRNSGIEKRHSVLVDLVDVAAEEGEPLFLAPDGTRLPTPGTGDRNAVYAREAPPLFEAVGRGLLEESGFAPEDVTHVVTVSCTGFFAPGPDFHLVRSLGLRHQVERYHVGFMGCYAAFQGLRMARAFCLADPEAVVLVVAAELCTLHLQFTDDPDDLIAGALFADGAAGALVSARSPAGRPSPLPHLVLDSFHADLAPEGEGDMAWTIGDRGFRMRLSTYVPEILEANLPRVLGTVLGRAGLVSDDVAWWAIHPGGRAIVDRAQEALGLEDAQVAASRQVLRDFGNMSSATVLFVLEALWRGGDMAPGDRVFAMAFGPGLTIETGLLQVERGPRRGE
jgi:predicted naringenin-chalcone synthase